MGFCNSKALSRRADSVSDSHRSSYRRPSTISGRNYSASSAVRKERKSPAKHIRVRLMLYALMTSTTRGVRWLNSASTSSSKSRKFSSNSMAIHSGMLRAWNTRNEVSRFILMIKLTDSASKMSRRVSQRINRLFTLPA